MLFSVVASIPRHTLCCAQICQEYEWFEIKDNIACNEEVNLQMLIVFEEVLADLQAHTSKCTTAWMLHSTVGMRK